MKKIEIIEVGPRDGLQNESKHLSIEQKTNLIHQLIQAGLKRIEVGAFVSPHWVPQMNHSLEVVEGLKKEPHFSQFSVLAPNVQGMNLAIASGIRQVAIFGACSESFSKKNINCTIEESFVRFKDVCTLAKKNKIRVRGYLSVAFGCPYEGDVPLSRVVSLAKRMKQLGVFEISIGDTIGVANPIQVKKVVKALIKAVGSTHLALHFHDTRGCGLANVLSGLQGGITRFDSAIGGVGGCPYAQGASGNIATEDLEYMLSQMGYQTGLDLKHLQSAARELEKILEKTLPSKLSKLGL